MSVQEFIDKYDYQNVNQKDLESITDDNKVDKFQQFENFILPFIEQEYNKMSFIDFDKKYGCLNSIGIENIDTLIINRAYGLIKDGLSWEDFIQKYYVETITENENKNDKNERWAIIEILINNGDAKKIINGLDSEIIHSLYENLIPKNKIIKIDNESKKTDIEMRQEIEVYCQNIIALKNTIENKSEPEAVKLAKIWFSEDDNLAREKSLKLKFIIDEYKKEIMSEDGESTENNWKGFSEMYILKHMYSERIKEYKKLEPEYEKIKDLCAKADNLNNQVQLFYRNLNGAFNSNITKLNNDYTNKNKILICGFLAKIRPNLKDYGMGIYPRLKRLLEIMHESNRYMKDTKISSVYNKYNNLFNSDDAAAEIRRFFSSNISTIFFTSE